MWAGLVSSAACEIQLTADCELLLSLAQLVVVQWAGLAGRGFRRSAGQSPPDLYVGVASDAS